ncbi:glycosyltransferase family 4 protein [Magnetospira sp. QH-2]|uniref:glycosyltransferase family 4 protein n=1 Tax=Magnetospira sp. (strain QH-2) TaxID=1288970 RepID=UPI0003E81110|nr:glycosyltransferase family 4 protein [Magnetospira sp. QH-2]CCQ72962.1 putative GT4 : distantly related to 1, 2-diacylglycerol 3-glucosyltransferase [Magnetospira sp. QH-2]
MKILYHHRTRSKDGQNVHIEELTGALRKLGHEIIMVAPGGGEQAASSSNSESEGGLIDFIRGHLPKFIHEILELAYAFKAYRSLVQAHKAHNPDVFYERYNLFLPSGIWLKNKTGLPMLLEVNAPLAEERDKFGGLALRSLARWSEAYAWRHADHVLPVTDVLADHVRAVGVPDDRISIIPNGINEDYFKNTPDMIEAKKRLGLDGRLVLGFTGFVRDWHRLDSVIDMMADAPPEQNLHLLLVGDGPERAKLEKQARDADLEDRFTVTGVIGRHEIPEHVAAFDIALQPAVTPYASPLKLFEYLYLGCAVVAPSMPNIEEVLVDEQNALLFDAQSEQAMRQAIERLITDDSLRAKLGDGARATIEERDMTWVGNAKRVTALFETLLDGKAPSTRP